MPSEPHVIVISVIEATESCILTIPLLSFYPLAMGAKTIATLLCALMIRLLPKLLARQSQGPLPCKKDTRPMSSHLDKQTGSYGFQKYFFCKTWPVVLSRQDMGILHA